jgi:hypothetical protein
MMNHADALARWTALGITAVAVSVAAGLAPEPDPVPRRWQLDAVVGPLRLFQMEVAGEGVKSFLYMTYKVTNSSGQDLLFAPSFELAAGPGVPTKAGRGVPAEVTKALLDKSQNPLLQDQIAIIGQLLQGPENAKEGLVVFALDGLNPKRLTVYAAGFSGETATVVPPGGTEKDKVLLRKSLALQYTVTGELLGRGDVPLNLAERRWVMR